ncbi:MAG: response regulator [Patescibacteria group bacterium]
MGPKILIVDDDKDFLEVLATKFTASGFNVVTADNGEEAITKAKTEIPDIILSDVKMPKMDGVQALLKLKEDPKTAHIRVVLLTAFGDPQQEIYSNDKRFAQELGAFEYLLKSQDLDTIVSRVQASLAKGT